MLICWRKEMRMDLVEPMTLRNYYQNRYKYYYTQMLRLKQLSYYGILFSEQRNTIYTYYTFYRF